MSPPLNTRGLASEMLIALVLVPVAIVRPPRAKPAELIQSVERAR